MAGAEEVLAMGGCDKGAQELVPERARTGVRALGERLDGCDARAAGQATGQVGLAGSADALDADQRAPWSRRQAGCHVPGCQNSGSWRGMVAREASATAEVSACRSAQRPDWSAQAMRSRKPPAGARRAGIAGCRS